MLILGLQKLTLLDYPGQVACTVFTGGCNFRCPFCHNGDLVLRPQQVPAIALPSLLAFLDKRRGMLDGICITGGEPLLQPDIAELCQAAKTRGYLVKLDTNGSFPDRLQALVQAGLVDYVAMDVKNAPARYGETVGCRALDLTPVRKSVAFLLSGAVDYEFRTTVVREYHGQEEMAAIGQWIQGARRYYLQAFADSANVLQPGLHSPDGKTLAALAQQAGQWVETVEIRGV